MVVLTMMLLSCMLSCVSGVGGEGGTHHDAPIMHVELWLWVGWVWVGLGGTHHDATITHVELWFCRNQFLLVVRHDLHQIRHHLSVLRRTGPEVTENISYILNAMSTISK